MTNEVGVLREAIKWCERGIRRQLSPHKAKLSSVSANFEELYHSFTENTMAHLDADSSNQEDLQEVDEQYRFALIQSVRSKEGADDFVRAVSSNLLLHGDCNWGQLLSAAPKALCSLGQCFVAATSSTAISAYELPKVEGLQ